MSWKPFNIPIEKIFTTSSFLLCDTNKDTGHVVMTDVNQLNIDAPTKGVRKKMNTKECHEDELDFYDLNSSSISSGPSCLPYDPLNIVPPIGNYTIIKFKLLANGDYYFQKS